jgi:2-haloacid dehalogenase
MSASPGAIRALMFDCYGTLVRWYDRLEEALAAVAARHGLDVEVQSLQRSFSLRQHEIEAGEYQAFVFILRTALTDVFAEMGVVVDDADCELFLKMLSEVPAFPDTPPALRELGERYPLIVVSNSDDEFLASSLQGIATEFAAVVTAKQAGAYKPARAMFELAVQRAAVPVAEVVHVAASGPLDVVPAGNFGLRCVWVDRHDAGTVVGEPTLRITSLAELGSAIQSLEDGR